MLIKPFGTLLDYYLLLSGLFFILFGSARPCIRQIFINETDQAGPCKQTSLNIIQCSSIIEVFRTQNLNSTCIYIQSKITLNETISIKYVNDLSISTSGNRTTLSIIACARKSGFSFSNTRRVLINNLIFVNCGSNIFIEWGNELINISSAVSFIDSGESRLEYVTFNTSLGYAIISHESNDVSISHTTVMNSFQDLVIYRDGHYANGGGILVDWHRRKSNNISIANSSFFGSYYPKNLSEPPSTLPYGNGAGVTIYFGQNSRNNEVILQDVHVFDNSANMGTGLFVEFSEYSNDNYVLATNLTLVRNAALKFGGSIFTSQNSNSNNVFALYDSRLSENQASVGGAITFVASYAKNESVRANTFILEDIEVSRNMAKVGSAIHLNHVFVSLRNVNISHSNSRACDVSPGQGSVFALHSTLNFTGDSNVFEHNNNSALILDSSEIFADGSLFFLENFGYNGGAIAFYEHASLYLTQKTQLAFHGNLATNAGGAMFVLTPGPPLLPWSTTELNMYHCFILFYDTTEDTFKGNVVFMDNLCNDTKSHDIFASSLQNCRMPGQNRSDILTSWKNFLFNRTGNSISTNAIHMSPLLKEEWVSYPGDLLNPHIVLSDERNNNVSESIEIFFKPSYDVVEVESNPSFVVDNNETIKLSLLNMQERGENRSFLIEVRTTSDVFLESKVNIQFRPCRFGYKLINNSCHCDLINNEDNGIALCDSENIYLERNRWVDPQETTSYVCPTGYCNPKRYTTYTKDMQCVGNRAQTSRLCSECAPNYSTVTASVSCQVCDDDSFGWLWVSSVAIIGLSLFIAFVMLLNIDIMSFNINICLYAYEVIDLLYTSDQSIDPFLSFVMSVFQFTPRNSLYPSYCLWNGMNSLHKVAYGYLIPFWMIIFMVILYFIVRDKRKWLERWYKTMSIVLVMCFSDLIRVSFELLHYTTIDNKKYLFKYAAAEYFGGEHLVWGIVAILVLLAIILFSIAQIAILLRADIDLFEWLRKFEDNVTAYFKHGKKWFWIFYFVCRLWMYAIGIFMPNSPILQMSLLGLSCFLITIIFSFQCPFKNDFINIIESIVFTTLTVICVLGTGINNLFSPQDQHSFTICIHLLSYVPLLAVIGSILKKLPALKNFLKKRTLGRRASRIYHPVRVFESYDDHHHQYGHFDDRK